MLSTVIFDEKVGFAPRHLACNIFEKPIGGLDEIPFVPQHDEITLAKTIFADLNEFGSHCVKSKSVFLGEVVCPD